MAGLPSIFGFVKFMVNGQRANVPTKEAVEQLGKYLDDKIDKIDLPDEVKSREFLSDASVAYVASSGNEPAKTRITFDVESVMGTPGTAITVDLPAAEIVEDTWNLDIDDDE